MSDEDKTKRAPLTEDQPTSGMNPTETSQPIEERQEKPKTPQNESADGERRVLEE